MTIGIVGAGKVGCSIGKYLREHGISVAGYYSRSKESVESAATFTETKSFHSFGELLEASDICFVTTPDDVISQVWGQAVGKTIQGKIFCHFSGSLSSAVFSNRKEAGVSACSIHPMYAFSDKFTSYEKLNQVIFTMEGDEAALSVLRPLFEGLGNRVCVMDSEKKSRYHAAASMVSNMMIGLYEMGIDMLEDCGFSRGDSGKLIEPLVRGNIEALLSTTPELALTGPIERGDAATVEKHLSVLTEEERAVYVNLGRVLVGIARRKNPTRDYTAMEQQLV
jgi:predicted short-subunit dehydrogenase-like oxidoreductase (DUF2520 family)